MVPSGSGYGRRAIASSSSPFHCCHSLFLSFSPSLLPCSAKEKVEKGYEISRREREGGRGEMGHPPPPPSSLKESSFSLLQKPLFFSFFFFFFERAFFSQCPVKLETSFQCKRVFLSLSLFFESKARRDFSAEIRKERGEGRSSVAIFRMGRGRVGSGRREKKEKLLHFN